MNHVTAALIVFLVVIGVNILALVIDAGLAYVWKVATISEHVWANPVWAVPLILWQVIGVFALSYHLLHPVIK